MKQKVISIMFLLFLCQSSLLAQERMIYAEITMTKADTVSIDLSSTCQEYRNIVMKDENNNPRHFFSLQSAVNHLARYGWKVSVRSSKAITMQMPYSVAIVYGESGLLQLELMMEEHSNHRQQIENNNPNPLKKRKTNKQKIHGL